MPDIAALKRAAELAAGMYQDFDHGHVAARASYEELLTRFQFDLPDGPTDATQVIDEIARDMQDGLVLAGSPRFFGWVIGGSSPGAIGADWLLSALDQNPAIYQCSPSANVIEEVAGEWLKDILRLPAEASFALVTGCQMANFTCLAAARHRLLADRGVDVETDGMAGAPQIRVIAGPHRHETLIRAMRYLGIGSSALQIVDLDVDGRLDTRALERKLDEDPRAPTIICLMAGDLNTGNADPFPEACRIAHDRGAWVHVDGAFGLWMNASPALREVLTGIELADSWATDGHKWLQLPYDNGFAFVRDREAHRASMTSRASYFIAADGSGRDAVDWNPEWSRRARGVVVYAALREHGRSGVARIIEEGCRLADRLVRELGALPGAEVVAPAGMNQGLVRFLADDGDHDRRTDAVAEAVRAEGTAWFGTTNHNGLRAMRISVSNYRTTDKDVDKTVDAVRRVLENTP